MVLTFQGKKKKEHFQLQQAKQEKETLRAQLDEQINARKHILVIRMKQREDAEEILNDGKKESKRLRLKKHGEETRTYEQSESDQFTDSQESKNQMLGLQDLERKHEKLQDRLRYLAPRFEKVTQEEVERVQDEQAQRKRRIRLLKGENMILTQRAADSAEKLTKLSSEKSMWIVESDQLEFSLEKKESALLQLRERQEKARQQVRMLKLKHVHQYVAENQRLDLVLQKLELDFQLQEQKRDFAKNDALFFEEKDEVEVWEGVLGALDADTLLFDSKVGSHVLEPKEGQKKHRRRGRRHERRRRRKVRPAA